VNLIKDGKVPKGNVFEMSRAAGLLGIKHTPYLLPDCHPIPIEAADIKFRIEDRVIFIEVNVSTIAKTGVEVEAMHGASVTALNIYDMLKPVDKSVELRSIRLVTKKGGKSDFTDAGSNDIRALLVVCSDSVAAGKKSDSAGKIVMEILQGNGITESEYLIISDDRVEIEQQLITAANNMVDLLIFCGGTGLSPRDNTPDVLEGLIEKRIPGIEEAIRNYGQSRTPYAMLSRSIAGTYKDTLVLALPGSTKGAEESMNAVFPAILHIFSVRKGMRHDQKKEEQNTN
jgi:molybdenum cofactor biosynthesis protein MoaC